MKKIIHLQSPSKLFPFLFHHQIWWIKVSLQNLSYGREDEGITSSLFFINSALNDDNWYFITPISCSLSLSLPCWLWLATGGTVWVAAPGPRVGSILLSPPNPSNATAVDDGPPVYSCFTAKGSSTTTRCTEKAASRDPGRSRLQWLWVVSSPPGGCQELPPIAQPTNPI